MLAKHLAAAGLLFVLHWRAGLANTTWTPKGHILGKLCGEHDAEGMQYLGIPYAQPPVGELRFAAPQPYNSNYPEAGWNGTFLRSPCPQRLLAPGMGANSVDEDCLSLNVYVPFRHTADPRPLPVRVWIHGGGQYVGSNSEPLYDGCPSIANSSDTILVTINYRLGALGFLALPGLFNETTGVGNWALKDQQLALRWVNENIQYFGGDSDSVTIFGHSAAGTAVYAQMVAKGSDGLFSRAISQSGPTVELSPLENGYETGKVFAQKLNCTTPGGTESDEEIVTCMRAANVSQLLDARMAVDIISYAQMDTIKLHPIIDGVFLPEQIIDAVAGGRSNKGPNGEPIAFMAGATKNDAATILIGLVNGTEVSSSNYTMIVNRIFPEHLRTTASIQYDPAKYNGSNFDAAADLLTDFIFQCPKRRFLAAHWSSCNSCNPNPTKCRTYGYHFTHFGHCRLFGPIGVPHGSELPFVFNNPTDGLCTWDQDDRELSRVILSSWNNFAQTGDPSVPGTPLSHWPKWSPSKPRYGILTIPESIGKTSLKEKCTIFDEIAGWNGA